MSVVTVEAPAPDLLLAIAEEDNWPHTRRPMPWLMAAFIAALFLVPAPYTVLKVHLPANPTVDRLLLIAMAAVLLLGAPAARARRRQRMTPIEVAVLSYFAVALLSVVVNIDRIYMQDQLGAVEKHLAQLFAYVAFFFIVVAGVRAGEMAAFGRLIMALTCVTAVGTLIEARTGYNIFYLWAGKLLSPVAKVAPSPTDIHPLFSRPTIVGPTGHGLALATMLTMSMPFAILPLLETRRKGAKLFYLIVIGLVLAACLSTQEKTALLAPIAAGVVLIAYKRQLLRWVPIAVIALVPLVHVASPGALGKIENLFAFGGSADYSDGRALDYPAVAPDILSHPIIGRGYGTLDPHNWLTQRILDNQYLDELFTGGILGLLAYMSLAMTALVVARGVIKSGGSRGPPALAAAAGCAAYGLVSATFDAMGYPQTIYAFLFACGLIAIAAKDAKSARQDELERLFALPQQPIGAGFGGRDSG